MKAAHDFATDTAQLAISIINYATRSARLGQLSAEHQARIHRRNVGLLKSHMERMRDPVARSRARASIRHLLDAAERLERQAQEAAA